MNSFQRIKLKSFLINQYSSSGTKIEKVEVRNGSKSLVKKARNISKSGYYEIRLN